MSEASTSGIGRLAWIRRSAAEGTIERDWRKRSQANCYHSRRSMRFLIFGWLRILRLETQELRTRA